MMKFLSIGIAFLLLFFVTTTFAQSGCFLSSNNRLYTYEPFNNGAFSSKSGVVSLSSGYCSWRQITTSSSSCRVCSGPNSITYNTSTNEYISCDTPIVGVRGSYEMVRCPLDSDAYFLLGFSVFTAVLIVRRDFLQPRLKAL